MIRDFVKDCIDLESETFCGSLIQVRKNLGLAHQDLIDKGYKDIVFDWYSDYDYQAVRAYFYRPETDEEMNKRKKKLEKNLAKLKKDESTRRELYEELKKEFEA